MRSSDIEVEVESGFSETVGLKYKKVYVIRDGIKEEVKTFFEPTPFQAEIFADALKAEINQKR